MDPLSHAALGASLGTLTAGAGRVRGVVGAAVAGAMIPDLDLVVMPFGWDRYLRVHEIGTHSLLGTTACALAAALVCRRDVRHHEWRLVLLAGWLGAAGHVLLDLVSSARVRVFWPIADRQVTIPLVAMADPWLAGLLALTIPALWLHATARRRTIAALLCAAALFLGVKAVVAGRAVRQYLEAPDTQADAYIVEARWASLGDWHVFDRRGAVRRQWRTGHRGVELLATWTADAGSEGLAASRRLGAVGNFLHVHDLAFPIAIARPGGSDILWSDPRFCWRPAADDAARLQPAIAPSGTLACAVWVGGAFDARGAALRQVVHVFGFTQTRAVE